MISIYKIIFNDKLNFDHLRISDIDKEKISEIEIVSYFDWVENDNYKCILISTPFEINRFLQILNNNFIKYSLSNLSDNVLKFKIDLAKELKNKINLENSIKYDLFVEDLNQWLEQNLDIDMILDRISEVGLANITDIEKVFLKGYKK
jgi:hypothetical protein